MKPNVVAIIVARGGSKGLPRKNILPLAGKPLIAWSIEPALASSLVDRVIVCTDDQEIAAISRQYGAETPFMRDPALGQDHVGCNEVMIWTVNRLFETGLLQDRDDITVYLQPTDLFKRPEWIDDCIRALIENPEADSAFLGCREHKNYWEAIPSGGYQPIGGRRHPGHDNRQQKPAIFREDTGMGAAIRARTWLEKKSRLGDHAILIPKEYDFFDIHGAADLMLAEQYALAHGLQAKGARHD